MSFEFRPAKRENVPLLIGLAGGTGSGKTYSAMLLAKGLAAGKRFAVIDTENGRARHYADEFEFDSADLRAPFRPERYAEAIESADKAGYPVIVVDSMSHEHAGDGGLLDWHEEEFKRMGSREAVKFTAWIAPKLAHKAMVTRLLQVNAHVVLCFRAEEKIEIGKDSAGKTVVRPKQSLVGLDGWLPVSEKTLPYELTASFLLTADAPGVPKPIKLQAQHRAFIPLDKPLSLETGRELAEWAAGGAPRAADSPAAAADAQPDPEQGPAASDAQRKKLDVLVGSLRDAGYLTTEHLYKGMGLDPEMGRGEDGELHWSPLRESLSRDEASALIERLTALDERVEKPKFPIPESARA